MRIPLGKLLPVLAGLAMLMLAAGCGEKTCHFVVPDAQGLEAGAPVEWHNATIGTVKSVQTVGDGVRVDIAFDAGHAKSVHDGVTAWIQNNPKRWPTPYVELFGGLDANRPVLANGVRIPAPRSDNVVQEKAMRVGDWLTMRRVEELGFLAALLAFLKIFGKRIGAFFKKLFWLAVLAMVVYIVWSFHSDWESQRERFSDLKKGISEWVMQNGETIQQTNKGLEILEPLVEDED